MISPGDPTYGAHDLFAVECPSGARFAISIDRAYAEDRKRWADETAINRHGHACQNLTPHIIVTASVSDWRPADRDADVDDLHGSSKDGTDRSYPRATAPASASQPAAGGTR